MKPIREQLFERADPSYRNFTARLIPNLDPETIIGVRMPALRKLAKQLASTKQATQFLHDLPHSYHEENNLHALLIRRIKEYEPCLAAVKEFLGYIDNWATCDTLSVPCFQKNKQALKKEIKQWICSEQEYTVRFGIGTLMRYYLDEDFQPEILDWVIGIEREEYYINMMRAWFFATAMAKQPEAVFPVFEKNQLDEFTHHKAIQKCVESFRIDDQTKTILKTMIHRKKKGAWGTPEQRFGLPAVTGT